MKRLLSARDLSDIARGSSIYATGGAFSYREQERLMACFEPYHNRVALWSLEDLAATDCIATVYGVGPAGGSPDALAALLPQALRLVANRYQRTIAALFPGETGIEGFLIPILAELGLPILDADGTGGRAVPEIRIDNFLLAGQTTVPLIALRDDGAHLILEDPTLSGAALERAVRAFGAEAGGRSVLVLDHLTTPQNASLFLSLGVIERSRCLGSDLRNNRTDIPTIVKSRGGRIIDAVTIDQVALERRDGFLCGAIEYGGKTGQRYRSLIKNEHIALKQGPDLIACAPDLITVIDAVNRTGIHNAEATPGATGFLALFPAEARWQTSAGKAMFSPEACALDLEYAV